jgi:hypothetical protein
MRTRRRLLPFWLKLFYTAFMGIMIPIYWRAYGPADFLWFCDAAAILTIFALWLESPLLTSINAVAMTLPQTIWIIDFITGGHVVGVSKYMFDSGVPLHVRLLSTFHLWLPFLLIWMTRRLGYDRRAFLYQTILSTLILLACYALTDPRHPPTQYPAAAVNVNRVYGPSPTDVQHAMPALLYLGIEIVFWPFLFYLPTHAIFKRVFRIRRKGT